MGLTGSDWRKLINDEFMTNRLSEFRKWYFNKFAEWELTEFKEDYYNNLATTQNYIPFVKWFVEYFLDRTKTEILVLKTKQWNILGGESINAPFPPERIISLGKNTEAVAYNNTYLGQKANEAQITLQELNSIVRSQNFSNAFLTCIGDQFISLEKEVADLKSLIEKQIANQKLILEKIEKNNSQNCENISTSIINEAHIIQPPTNIKGFKLDNESTEFISILEEKLKKMNLNVLSHKDNSDNSEIIDDYDSD
jgi:hypothetical protein